MDTAATTSQMLLIGSPRLMAIPARQTAAATATAPHARYPRTLFTRMSLLKPLQAAQQRIAAGAVRELYRVDRLPVLVERADVSGFLADGAHQDNGIGATRIGKRAVLRGAGLALPAVPHWRAELADHGPVIVARGQVQVGLVFGRVDDARARRSTVQVHYEIGGYDAHHQRAAHQPENVRIGLGFEANSDHRRRPLLERPDRGLRGRAHRHGHFDHAPLMGPHRTALVFELPDQADDHD